ncbi:MAG TPA: CHC2 zinc finger domain-containing protein [Candidatus Saccharimonas sp.]|nr:CHC2 zinc finger domain-containing protein [Candidatus Saccharimonas sp.]
MLKVNKRYCARVRQTVAWADVLAALGVQSRHGKYVMCPVHDELTPSCRLWPDGRYLCLGCGATGDIVDYVQWLSTWYRHRPLRTVRDLKRLLEPLMQKPSV